MVELTASLYHYNNISTEYNEHKLKKNPIMTAPCMTVWIAGIYILWPPGGIGRRTYTGQYRKCTGKYLYVCVRGSETVTNR